MRKLLDHINNCTKSIWKQFTTIHNKTTVCMHAQSCPTLLWPNGPQSTRLLCPWNFQTRILESLPLPPPGDLRDPGIEPASPVSVGKFFTTWAKILQDRFFTTWAKILQLKKSISHSVMPDSLQLHNWIWVSHS